MRHRDPMDAPPPRLELWNLARASARASDPETSRDAARQAEESGSAGRQRALCLAEVERLPGQTAAEIARAVGMERHAPSRRLPELRDARLVTNGPARICAVTGKASLTWLMWEPKPGPIVAGVEVANV